MSWVCEMCSTNNDDSIGECFVCGNKRPAIIVDKPVKIIEDIKVVPSVAEPPCIKRERIRSARRVTLTKTTVFTAIVVCIVALSFIGGQLLQYLSFGGRGNHVLFVSDFFKAVGGADINLLFFLIIMSGIGLIASIVLILACYLNIKNKNYLTVIISLVVFSVAMVFVPSLSACAMLIYGIILLAFRERKKVCKIIAVVFTVCLIIVFVNVNLMVSTILETKFTVNFDFSGGEGGTSLIEVSLTGEISFTVEAPVREGYGFCGYFDSPEGGNMYINGEMLPVKKWDKGRGGVLYAHWKPNKYTVTLDKNGGVGGTDSVTATFGEFLPKGAAAPNRLGYEFLGYCYLDENGDVIHNFYSADMSPQEPWGISSNVSLYAMWGVKTVKIEAENEEIYGITDKKSTKINIYGGSGVYSEPKIDFENSMTDGVRCTLKNGILTVEKIAEQTVGYVNIVVTDLVTGLTASVDVYFFTVDY